MERSQGRDYHEAFARQETLINQIDKYQKLIEMYKNENAMWKERYEQAKRGNFQR